MYCLVWAGGIVGRVCDELLRRTVNSSLLHILKKGTTRHPKDPRYIPITLYITQKSFPRQNCRANKLRTYVRLFPGKITIWLTYCAFIPPKRYRSKSAKKSLIFLRKMGTALKFPHKKKNQFIIPASLPHSRFEKKKARDDFSGERNEDWCVYFFGYRCYLRYRGAL